MAGKHPNAAKIKSDLYCGTFVDIYSNAAYYSEL